MKKGKKLISAALISAMLVQSVPLPAFAGYTNPYEIDTSKMQDILQSEGTLIGVYEPYKGTFKLIHYWKGMGVPNPDVERLSNTYCVGSQNQMFEVFLDTNLKYSGGGRCQDYTGINGDIKAGLLKKCSLPDNREVIYNTQTGNIVSVARLTGRLCQRYVNTDYIRKYLKDINVNDMFSAGKGEGVARDLGSAKETYFTNFSQEEAIALMTSYMRQNNISTGIFAVETFYTRTEKKGKIRKKIITRFYETPTYHLIVKGINAGIPLGNGYYLIKEGEGLNLTKANIEVHKIERAGWSFLGAFLVSLVVGGVTGGLGVLVGLAGVPSVIVGVVGSSALTGALSGALIGAALFNTSWLTQMRSLFGKGYGTGDILVFQTLGWKKRKDIIGDGADQLADRLRSGSDMDPNLSAYYENSYTKTSYDKMTKGGSFSENKKEKMQTQLSNIFNYSY